MAAGDVVLANLYPYWEGVDIQQAMAENASFYFLNLISWGRAEGVSYFYFEAFDETWKAIYEGPQGAHWGVWDKNGNLKPGMKDVFDGRTIPNNWAGPVGGIAELPEITGKEAASSEPSETNYAFWAGIAAAAAVGTIALVGTAWYARRRWLS